MNALGGKRQRGVVAIMVAIGLLALLAMVGLALDSGHAVLNKSRLQNTVDAAALTAAKVLDATASEDQATAAARNVFDLNAASQPELSAVMTGADITVQYSNTLNPWAPGSAPANYVRVIADNFTMWTSFTSLVGITETRVAASAVAGPSAPVGVTEGNEACDIAPMLACADVAAGEAGDWGYSNDNVTVLKLAAQDESGVGPGNYHLIQLGGPGANIVRENLAGSYGACIDPGANVETQTGVEAGPVAQGLNTRFGEYEGGMQRFRSDYPPDKVTTATNPELAVGADGTTVIFRGGAAVGSIDDLDFSYDNYTSQLASGPYDFDDGVPRRRVLAVPFVDCAGPNQGQSSLPVVGLGCFFILQPVQQQGQSGGGNDNNIFGEYIGQCAADGTPGPVPDPNPVEGPGIYKIVLHNDPLSPDS
jgi:Flp pilus assembly protein TadG